MNDDSVAFPAARGSKARFLTQVRHYRGLLARRWWVLAAGLAVGLASAAAISWWETPACVSVGRMIVSIKLSLPEGAAYSEELNNFLGTQTALMQSAGVVSRAHERALARDPALGQQLVDLRVSVSPKTSIFVLEATGRQGPYVQSFLQACMEEYIELKKQMRTQTSDSTLAGLTASALRLERELRQGEEELAQFQKSNHVVLLQEQGNAPLGYIGTLNQRLASLQSDYDLLASLTPEQNLERQNSPGALPQEPSSLPPGAPAPPEAATAEPDYFKARQVILLLKAERQDLAQFLRPAHPKIVALTEEINRRERLLEIFRQQSAEQLEGRKHSLERQLQAVQRALAEWNEKALELQRQSAEQAKLRANLQRLQGLYDRLLATLQTLDINKQISPESVTLMEPASPPRPADPHRLRRFLVASALSAALALGLVLFLDHLDDRVNTLLEVESFFDEPVLVQIPLDKHPQHDQVPCLLQANDDRHSLVEAYRSLRSSLLYSGEFDHRPRTLLCTSSVPNEGKSLTSSNLAIILAQAGARVLLVDADLRKGVLHARFGCPPETGLSEVLRLGLNWESAVASTAYPTLSLLPRGRPTQQSSELFIAQTTRQLLKSAALKYDYVIVDTAPVMAADDVTSLAPHADAVLFVLRARHTSARVAHAALDLLYHRRARVLGIVFNGVHPRSADYRYYYQYAEDRAADPLPANASTGELVATGGRK